MPREEFEIPTTPSDKTDNYAILSSSGMLIIKMTVKIVPRGFCYPQIVSLFKIQGDSRSFTPTYGAYSWGNLVQNLLINLGSVLNSYGVIVDFLNASL
jgi:hypothetical protein